MIWNCIFPLLRSNRFVILGSITHGIAEWTSTPCCPACQALWLATGSGCPACAETFSEWDPSLPRNDDKLAWLNHDANDLFIKHALHFVLWISRLTQEIVPLIIAEYEYQNRWLHMLLFIFCPNHCMGSDLPAAFRGSDQPDLGFSYLLETFGSMPGGNNLRPGMPWCTGCSKWDVQRLEILKPILILILYIFLMHI